MAVHRDGAREWDDLSVCWSPILREFNAVSSVIFLMLFVIEVLLSH